MSQELTWICNKCGERTRTDSHQIPPRWHMIYLFGNSYHLCGACSDAIAIWVKSKKSPFRE